MSDEDDNNGSGSGGRAPLTLKPRQGAVSSGTVRQRFSHGRSKTVVVETKRRRVDAPTLGLHHHGLGSSVAEALAHRAGADGALAGLQRQGRTPAGAGTVVVVFVAHSLALLGADVDRPPYKNRAEALK